MKDVFTADHEEPDCMRCDYICGSHEFCGENCGPEHGWNGYQRTVITTADEDALEWAYQHLSR